MRVSPVFLLLAALLAATTGSSSAARGSVRVGAAEDVLPGFLGGETAMQLHLVSQDAADRWGAACLDGSLPGFYWREGKGSDASNLVIWLQGGGWCYDEASCLSRAGTKLGSSKAWAQTYPTSANSGLLSTTAAAGDFSMAYVQYCDGASFASARDGPVPVNETASVMMRGQANLDAVLSTVMEMLPARSSDGVSRALLGGCSAGGLATYLHAPYVVKTYLGDFDEVTIAPDAGWFQKRDAYKDKMEYVHTMGNVSLPSMFAVDAFPLIPVDGSSVKMAAVQAIFDTWQLNNILTPPLGCTPPACSAERMAAFAQYGKDQVAEMAPMLAATDMTAEDGTRRVLFLGPPPSKLNPDVLVAAADDGYFVDACVEHCQVANSLFLSRSAAGTKMAAFFAAALGDDAAVARLADTPQWPGNPSCPTADAKGMIRHIQDTTLPFFLSAE